MRKIALISGPLLLLAIAYSVDLAAAQNLADPVPSRHMTVIQSYTEFEWWLLSWADNSLACRILTDQKDLPSLVEVKADCTAEVYKAWFEQPLCSAASNGGDLAGCRGYYLYYLGSQQAEREVVVVLPPVSVTLRLEGCAQTNYENICPRLPYLQITGVEPLPEHSIIQVHFEYRGRAEVCQGAVCEVPLRPTTMIGERIVFWADSSYGDSSAVYEARLRVKPNGDGTWQIDLLSDRIAGLETEAFSWEWNAFPSLGENPVWLSHPRDAASLASSEPYQYLAGQLIQVEVADAGACADGGLMVNGYASQCGLEAAMDEVVSWQNQFDAQIFAVAESLRLSPQLLKNLIAQESQFWPGEYDVSPGEYGLGRLTVSGTETLLMWNESFFDEFCPQILLDESCAQGFHHLLTYHQEMLRGAVASRVNLACAICEYGFDFNRVGFDIQIIAQSLLANAAQVEQIFENLTGQPAGASASYEDLWRFTLVNYNAGAGCLSAAITATQKGNADLSWQNVSGNLVGDCRAAISYVDNIAK